MDEKKAVQEGTEFTNEDPEYMTLDKHGQLAFDKMWEEGDTITADGYIE